MARLPKEGTKELRAGLITLIAFLAIYCAALKGWTYFNENLDKNQTISSAQSAPLQNQVVQSDKPTRLVALSAATSADLEKAFVFSGIQEFPSADLIYVSDQWGSSHLIDHTGKWIAAVNFAYPNFSGDGKDNLFPARLEHELKWGYINGRGEWVIQPRYNSADEFKNGVARVYLKEGALGGNVYIDTTGKLLTNLTPEQKALANPTPAQYTNANPVSQTGEGLTVKCVALRCGYVDAAGQWIIPPQFDEAFVFSDGAARVVKNGLLGYIDRAGHWLTPEPSASAAAIWYWEPSGLADEVVLSGYLDHKGKYLLSPEYPSLGDFSEGLAPAQAVNGKFGYINLSGDWVIPPVFREAGNFSEGWAMVNDYGHFSVNRVYINTQGQEQLAVPNEYQTVGEFKNGYAEVSDYSQKKLFMDKKGKIVTALPASIQPVERVPELQRLSINGGKWGYADANDHFVIAAKFDDANDFSGLYAAVKIGERWGFINRAGKQIIAPAYAEVGQFSEGLVRVKDEIGWTYIDEKGQPLTAAHFVVAADFHDGRAKISDIIQPENNEMNAASAPVRNITKHRRTRDYSVDASPPDKASKEPILIAEGGDMRQGVTTIKLANSYRSGHYLSSALLNNKGELIIPNLPPKSNR